MTNLKYNGFTFPEQLDPQEPRKLEYDQFEFCGMMADDELGGCDNLSSCSNCILCSEKDSTIAFEKFINLSEKEFLAIIL